MAAVVCDEKEIAGEEEIAGEKEVAGEKEISGEEEVAGDEEVTLEEYLADIKDQVYFFNMSNKLIAEKKKLERELDFTKRRMIQIDEHLARIGGDKCLNDFKPFSSRENVRHFHVISESFETARGKYKEELKTMRSLEENFSCQEKCVRTLSLCEYYGEITSVQENLQAIISEFCGKNYYVLQEPDMVVGVGSASEWDDYIEYFEQTFKKEVVKLLASP